MTKQWIACDLDGTLAERTTSGTIGKPIKPMWARVQQWIDDGYDVRIFTVRAVNAASVREVKAWLRLHGLPQLDVTNIKAPGLLALWDDRAVRVEPDTGNVCAGCYAKDVAGRHTGQGSAVVLTDC